MGSNDALFASSNSEWTVVSPEFWGRLALGHLDELVHHVNGSMSRIHLFPPWTSVVTRILIPINIQGSHWLVGENCLEDMVLTLYDSYRVQALYDRVRDTIIFSKMLCLLYSVPLETTHELPGRRKISAGDMQRMFFPQQTGVQGDCGPFTCLFLSDRANGQNPNMNIDIMAWRREMANTLWMLTGNQLNF